MHSILPILVLLAAGANTVTAGSYTENYPNRIYLDAMCLPTKAKLGSVSLAEIVASMASSPFPCEQRIYLERTCFANGTTTNDFLAEQQCLCGSNYFEALAACYDCQIAHGLVVTPSSLASFSSVVSSRSTAECSASPVTQGYTNLFTVNTSTGPYPDLTLSPDPFANDTRVANYWTGPTAPVAGKITGSAVQHQSSFTNVNDARFTPPGAVTTGGSVATPLTTSTGGSVTAPLATSTAGAAKARAGGGLVAAAIGVLAAL
ncbi:hypothetical protein VE00_02601 [Pseudogymnoascus sp. WSF 3629]|nr:hypothetical protein VE00_02601 [Pseudogymnoascus sp. WSF 3629]